MLVLVWVLAAFGEELVYRGYVLERAATLGHRTPAAWVLAMVVISVLFGVGHVYQGAAGVASSTFAGLYLGGLYLATRRNLWLPILTHGFSDTIAVAVIFLGLVEMWGSMQRRAGDEVHGRLSLRRDPVRGRRRH